MGKMIKHLRQVDECEEKIQYLLKEYRCAIDFDEEIKGVIIYDLDTEEFKQIKKGV